MRSRLGGCLLALLCGCRTPREPPSDAPAVIVRPTAQSRASLVGAVASALGATVTLRDDALTQESSLTLERLRRRDPQGHPAQGRDLGMPERFLLVLSAGRCVLVHERTGRRFPLEATECAPAARDGGA